MGAVCMGAGSRYGEMWADMGRCVRLARVLKVIESIERDCEIHVARWEVRLEVDGGGEVVEGGGVLPSVEVHQAEIVRDDPLEGVEIEGPF